MPRSVTLVLAAVLLVLVGPGGRAGAQDTGTTPPTTVAQQATGDAPVGTGNPFLPERQNVSDCFGALERPDCGSDAKGGWRQFLVLAVLILGLAIIGWRIVVAVRRADRVRHG